MRALYARFSNVLAAVLVVGLGCAESASPSQAAKTDPRVYVLEGTAGVDYTVEPDRLIFPRAGHEPLLELQPDDVLVGTGGSGLLRAVVSVASADGSVIVATRAAQLGEAVINGQVSSSSTMNGVSGTGSEDGKADTTMPFTGTISRSNFAYEEPGVEFKASNLELSFDPDFELDLDLQNREVSYFLAVAKGALKASIDYDLTVTNSVTVSKSEDLWTSEPQVYEQWIGSVPVIETVTLAIGVRVAVTATGTGHVKGSGSLSASVQAGIRYRAESGWENLDDRNVDFAPGTRQEIEAFAGDVTVRVSLYARLDMLFYDVAGPYLSIAGYAGTRYAADEHAWHDTIGISSSFGGAIDVFGWDLGASTTIFDYSCEF